VSRKVILTVVALVLVATLSGIGISCKPSKPAQFVTYTNEANEFSIDYPQGWRVEPDLSDPHIRVKICKSLWDQNVGVQVAKYWDEIGGLDSFSQSQIKAASNFEDYVPLSTEELTINGIPAIKHTYTATASPKSYKFVQIYLVKNETGWLLHFFCTGKDFDSREATFDTILNSFRLLK